MDANLHSRIYALYNVPYAALLFEALFYDLRNSFYSWIIDLYIPSTYEIDLYADSWTYIHVHTHCVL